jgi:hypothetical protein
MLTNTSLIAESGKNSKCCENWTDSFADLHVMAQNINEMLSTSQCLFRLSDEIDSKRVFDLFYQAHKFSKTYTPD